MTAGAARLREIRSRLLAAPAAQLLLRVARNLGEHEASQMASSISFYAILSLFPLILGMIAILGMFLPSATVQDSIIRFFEHNLPASTDLVRRNMEEIVSIRGALGAVSLLGLFWSGSIVFDAIGRAVNRAWGIRQRRPLYARKLSDLAMALGASALLLLSTGLHAALSLLSPKGLPAVVHLSDLAGRILAFIILLAVFLLLYKFAPNTRTDWRDIWAGALLAASLFEVARTLFTIYLQKWATYSLVYGSIASLIILLVWVYYSAFILILGAEICSQHRRMRRRGPGQPLKFHHKEDDREVNLS